MTAIVFAAGADPLSEALSGNILPKDAALTSYTSVFNAIEAADAEADEAWRRLKDRKEYDAYRAAMHARYVEAIGGFPARTPLNAQVRARLARNGYRMEKIIFESLPGVYVTAILYLPDAERFKPPYHAFLVTCGHSGYGKGDEDYSRACVMAAQQGLAAFIYDPIGQGERNQDPPTPNVAGHNRFGVLAMLVGRSTAQIRIWDGMRSMDYLDTRADIRHDGYGYMGNSGGGTMTSLIMSIDPRVKAAAPSCYLSTISEVFSHIGPQDAEQNVFGQLAFGLNHASFVLLGGNAVRMHGCHNDFFPFEGLRHTSRIVSATVENCGLGADRYGLTDVPGPHGWKESTRASSILWMRRWLAGDASMPPIDVQACRLLDVGYDWHNADCGLGRTEHQVTATGSVAKEPGFKSVYAYLRDDLAAAEARRKARDADETAALVAKVAGIRPLQELGAMAKEQHDDLPHGVRISVRAAGAGCGVPAGAGDGCARPHPRRHGKGDARGTCPAARGGGTRGDGGGPRRHGRDRRTQTFVLRRGQSRRGDRGDAVCPGAVAGGRARRGSRRAGGLHETAYVAPCGDRRARPFDHPCRTRPRRAARPDLVR